MTHRERPIYLYHALLLQVFATRLTPGLSASDGSHEAEDWDNYYASHREGPARKLEDYVFDLHTGVHSREGRTRFAREGALVVGESQAFVVPRYRELYLHFKAALDAHTAGRQG